MTHVIVIVHVSVCGFSRNLLKHSILVVTCYAMSMVCYAVYEISSLRIYVQQKKLFR